MYNIKIKNLFGGKYECNTIDKTNLAKNICTEDENGQFNTIEECVISKICQESRTTKKLIEAKYKGKPVICKDTIYENFGGECWNDSIQYIFAFTDNIKEVVQPKLQYLTIDEIFELAELNNRNYLIPYHFRDDKGRLAKHYKYYLKKYLEYFQKIFMIYINNVNDRNLQKLKGKSARVALDITCPIKEYSELYNEHGSLIDNDLFMIMLLSYILLDDNDSLRLYPSYTYEGNYNEINAVYITVSGKSDGHAIAFIKCNNTHILFDDNHSNKVFEWNNYLSNLRTSKKFSHYEENKFTIKDTNINDTYFFNIKLVKINNQAEFDEFYKYIYIILSATNNNYLNYMNKIKITDSDPYIKKIGNFYINYAVLYKNISVINYLLKKGSNINIQDTYGNTPLHTAIQNDFFPIIDLLLKKGANTNIQNNNGDTPLYKAASYGNVQVISLLLDKGANCNLQNKKRNTPLHIATAKKNIPLITLLLDKGADCNIKNSENMSPLEFSYSNKEINQLFLKKCKLPTQKNLLSYVYGLFF